MLRYLSNPVLPHLKKMCLGEKISLLCSLFFFLFQGGAGDPEE